MKKRLVIILFFVIIFVTFIVVWNFSYQKGLEEAYMPVIETPAGNFMPTESGVFKRSNVAVDYLNMPVDENHQRTLEAYYASRAFPGAPPSIPHPVAKERSLGGNTCLQCHQNGGFVEKYSAYAPITPHPEMVNCRQCHVTKNTNETFKEFTFSKKQPPKVGEGQNSALLGSPPVMPHQLQMRENCLSCHAGPSTPKLIRVSHPERVNCRQCHVPKTNEQVQVDINKFLRQFNSSSNE